MDPGLESRRIELLRAGKDARDKKKISGLREKLGKAAGGDQSIMEPLIDCAEGGVTLGEMMETLVEVFGEYRG